MKKRKFADGGMITPTSSNPANAFAPQGATGGLGAAAQMQPQIIMQAPPVAPPGQQSSYPSPAGTFPRAGFKKGGTVKKFAKGGSIKSSASRRGDGCASKGKTKGKFI